MKNFVIFCKSYAKDVLRAHRLIESVNNYNQDSIELFLSVPEKDTKLFSRILKNLKYHLITDEDILSQNLAFPKYNKKNMNGYITQQIVKAEFWRLAVSENYLCLDSDAVFIRDFKISDFMYDRHTPYSVYDEAQDLFLNAISRGQKKLYDEYKHNSEYVAAFFGRKGKFFSYGPMPIWSRKVWESFEQFELFPRNSNIFEMIQKYPHEVMIYGETLLKHRPIPIITCQPLFKTYHYAWQFDDDKRKKIDNQALSQLFLGTVNQSNWERELDWPKDSSNYFSKLNRKIKRLTGKI